MIDKPMELIVVKATEDFIAFLKKQADIDVNRLQTLLTIDPTGYFISQQQGPEDVVTQVSEYYSVMFLYECRRWLGHHFQLMYPPRLLDFSNCFEIERHQNVYFCQNSTTKGHLFGLMIKPTSTLLDWFIANTVLQTEQVASITAQSFSENASVILMRLDSIDDIVPFVKRHYDELAQFEQSRLGLSCFPNLSRFERFQRFFSLTIHQHLKFLDEANFEEGL